MQQAPVVHDQRLSGRQVEQRLLLGQLGGLLPHPGLGGSVARLELGISAIWILCERVARSLA